jgi:hypothetical protein
MGLYVVDLVRSGRRNKKRPTGWNLSSWNGIMLDARNAQPWGLVWFDNAVSATGVTKIADGMTEAPAPSARTALNTKLGADRDLSVAPTIAAIVVS